MPLLLVDFEDLLELNEPGVVGIEFRDELAELKLLEVDVESLEDCFEVVHAHEAVAFLVEVLEGSSAVADVPLG